MQWGLAGWYSGHRLVPLARPGPKGSAHKCPSSGCSLLAAPRQPFAGSIRPTIPCRQQLPCRHHHFAAFSADTPDTPSFHPAASKTFQPADTRAFFLVRLQSSTKTRGICKVLGCRTHRCCDPDFDDYHVDRNNDWAHSSLTD